MMAIIIHVNKTHKFMHNKSAHRKDVPLFWLIKVSSKTSVLLLTHLPQLSHQLAKLS